jgi:hypothetical protein
VNSYTDPTQPTYSDPSGQGAGFTNQFQFGQPPDLSNLIKQFLAKKQQQGLSQQQTMSSLAQAMQMLKRKQAMGQQVQDWGSDPELASLFQGV